MRIVILNIVTTTRTLVDIWVLSIPSCREENGAPVEVHLKLHRRLDLLGDYRSPPGPSMGEDFVAIYVTGPGDSRVIHLLSLNPEKEADASFVLESETVSPYGLTIINVVLF